MVQTTKCKLDTICVAKQRPRTQRRVNGLQLPLHPQQVVGWLTIAVTIIVNFTLIVPSQTQPFQDVAWLVLITLYLMHAVAHTAALLLDPAERQLRKLSRFAVPEFDRTKHAHVIENGRCHLCNIHTTSKNTKHCSICNKCVDGFDHHCKWLNHCIGRRNYLSFFLSVCTATLLSAATAMVCLCDIVLYFVRPQLLCGHEHLYLGLNQTDSAEYKYGPSGWKFVCVLSLFGLTNLIICCVLIHLCSFHVYISILGVSTYEYITRNSESEGDSQTEERHGCSLIPFKCWSKHSNQNQTSHICGKTNKWHKNKVGTMIESASHDASYLANLEVSTLSRHREVRGIIENSTVKEGTNVTHLMAMIMNNVNGKKKMWNFQPSVDPTADLRAAGAGAGAVTNLPSNILEENDVAEVKQEVNS